ncbi:MAG: hypothetical protein QXU18_05520 [Thermoplasmatales archaeon]
MLPWNYPYIAIVLLSILIYAGFEDLRKRKITTVTFLVADVALFFYYLSFDVWLALFLIPIFSEFFTRKFSAIAYIVLAVPLFFDLSFLTVSLAYSILLVKAFGVLVKNFGRGDVKVLQTISVAIPFYPHLQLIDSLFPPVLAVTFVASVVGVISSVIFTRRKAWECSIRPFSQFTETQRLDPNKFWIKDSMPVYKIPFVTFICFGYTLLLILSSLRLV